MEDITEEIIGKTSEDYTYIPETIDSVLHNKEEIEKENSELYEIRSANTGQLIDSIPEDQDLVLSYNPIELSVSDADTFLVGNDNGFNELDRTMEISAIRHLRLTQETINEILVHPAMNVLCKMKPESVTLELIEKMLAQKD
jgi:hypothetical protein